MKNNVVTSGKRNLVMTALLCLFGLCLQTQAIAQERDKKVSLTCKEEALPDALNRIERQSGYYKMNFNYDVLKVYKVTVTIRQKTVPEAVDILLQGLPFKKSINGKFIQISPLRQPHRQTSQKISGKVLDEYGEPVIGAAILIKGTQAGTITDVDGNFILESTKNNPTLIVSYVGMKTTEVVASANKKNSITLKEDSKMIDEVVVTGYQDIKKEKMTGSVTTIRMDKIDERYTTNIMDNLEGRVAGLSTYGGKTTIRGISTFRAETSPLLVVDGVPVEASIEDLNPYDIESVNVLKDAAATAIYGARASNGIIVITTKNAKKKGKIDIDFSANLTIYEKKNMDYADNFYMTPEQQVDVESNFWDYYYDEDPMGMMMTQMYLMSGHQELSPIQYGYYQLANGMITQAELDAQLDAFRKNNFAQEYADHVLRQRVLQQYNLALRSKSDKFQSNLTLNYKTDNSGQINTETNSLNINYKGVYDLAPWLTASFSVNGIYGRNKMPGADSSSQHTNPWAVQAYQSMFKEDGTATPFFYFYSGNSYWDVPEGYHDLAVNIVDEFYNNVQTVKRQYTRYHGDLMFKIIKGLTLNTQFIYENNHTTTSWHANPESHVARTIRNAYTVLENGKITYLVPENGGMLRTTNTDGVYWTARGQVNYINTFGKHAVAAIAGLEFRETKINGTKSLVLGYEDQLQNSATHTVDFGALSQMTSNLSYMPIAGGYPSQSMVFNNYFRDGMGIVPEERHRYASGYANLTYTYDEKYNLFGSYRKDYADVYGLNAKFRGKPLWSVGAGWNMHNEDFIKAVDWIDFLKLRVSLGVTGNIYQGATSYMTATSTGMNTLTNLPYGVVQSPGNPSLRWEQNRTTNVGVDFSLLNNRLRGSLDYYKKVGKDIFSNKLLDPCTGFSSMFVNMAGIENKGIELALSYDWFIDRRREDFGWSTSMTFSYNKNNITSVENPATTAGALIGNPYKVGYPTSALWSYRFAGISDQEGEKGSTLYYIENGNTSHSPESSGLEVLEYSGQSDPKVVMGMDNRFTWNGFSLNILMAYYGGHKMRAMAELDSFNASAFGQFFPGTIPSYYLNAWTPENPTDTPGIGQYGATSVGSTAEYSDVSIHDADFLKIRNIVFGYELPENWLKGIGVNRVSLRFQIDNPKYLWAKNKVGIDPETLGIRSQSSYIFGINVNL